MMQALSSLFCCLRSRRTRDPESGNGERDPLLSHNRDLPPVQEIPVEEVGDIIDVDAEGLRERLTFVVVHKRGKMVDVGSTLPFALSRPSSATRTRSAGRSASGTSRRRSSRPSPLPRQWDPQHYYSQHPDAPAPSSDPHRQPSSPSHSRQPSPTPSMQTHTSPTRSSMYDTNGLDGSLASLAGLPTFEVDRGSLAERRQSNVHVRILDYGSVARGRRSRSRGGRLASGSSTGTGTGASGEEGKMAVSPVKEVERHIERADEDGDEEEEEEEEDSVAGDLGGPNQEEEEGRKHVHMHDNPRQSSLSRERPSPDLDGPNGVQSGITQVAPLARSWGD